LTLPSSSKAAPHPKLHQTLNSGLPGYAAFAASLKPPSLRSGGIGKPRAVIGNGSLGSDLKSRRGTKAISTTS